MKKPVLVVGGGIAGIQASHDLAEMGVPVFLVEASPSIGGRMAQLDKTFPTNDCSACILAPKMTACFNHPLVKTLTNSQVLEVKGTAPNFTAVVNIKPRYVNMDLCKGCDACFEACPVKVENAFDMGIGTRKAIYKPFAQAVPNKAIIDKEACRNCHLCDKACQAKAIDHTQTETIVEIPVSAVVLSAGYAVTENIPPEFGYTQYKDVVTSLEFERILSAGGPFGGHIQRPSDGQQPKRIAFIQCVGSRDSRCGTDYCSSVCCMYAIKEAMIAKEHLPSIEHMDIYYMDMRAHGKDFDKYVDSAQNKYGIGFVKSRISEIKGQENGQLAVHHVNHKGVADAAPYDMVVLSVGVKPDAQNVALYRNMGVKTDKYGFIWAHEFNAPATAKAGIFACGVAAGPKDIPETVIEASAAAASAAEMAKDETVDLYQDYSAFFKEETAPPLRDVSKEPIKVGVFVCRCGVNIGSYADVPAIVDYAKTLPFVALSEEFLYACSIDAQRIIAEKIAQHGLNRVVVASCTPRTHEPLFQDVMAKAGLNPYLLTMANIRDQCTWVHMDQYDAATLKAQELVRMAVGKVTFAKALTRKKINVNKSALVIGGGVAGMSAALQLADMGFQAYLVEKTSQLGGNAFKLAHGNTLRPSRPYILDMMEKVQQNTNIEVFLNTTVENIDGYVGNFTTQLLSPENACIPREINHGAVIVAVGAQEKPPTEYMAEDNRVMTMLDLEATALDGYGSLQHTKQLVMIQCAGSRDEQRPYCSRVCCNQALKNAVLLKEQYPGMAITVLYRDIRAYGLNEMQYRQARKAGVAFVRYEPEHKPVVEKDSVTVFEPILGETVTLPADCVVVSAPIAPDTANNTAIAQMLKVPLNQEGFFLEAHVKLRPVDFATEGVYVCGLAHAPKNMKESIIQGKAAAGRAATVIAKEQLETEGAIATVDAGLCKGCGDCEKVCAYKAIEMQEQALRGQKVTKAVVNDVLCKGCGTCAATCRCGAMDVGGFSDKQVLSEIEYLLRKRNTKIG